MKTIVAKQLPNTQRKWYVVDAQGQTLGRLATQIAVLLKGKGKVDYTPHLDNGDYVVVINAGKVAYTGKKETDKIYYRHSGYLGHLKKTTLGELLEKKPTEVLKKAVAGMLPKNRLRKGMMLRLKLVAGDTHRYNAQQPETITF